LASHSTLLTKLERFSMDENKTQDVTQTTEPDGEYSGMPKWKAALLKCLPMLIVLVCTGLFIWGIKADYTRVKCLQTPSSYFYIYKSDEFTWNEEDYDNVANEHNDAHLTKVPEVYFVLNETAPDVEATTVKCLIEGNGLKVYQFGEFILYRLEGQYGVFAPLRDYGESTTARKNDLYVVRQLMKNDVWKEYEMTYRTDESFYDILEKLEWELDTEYAED